MKIAPRTSPKLQRRKVNFDGLAKVYRSIEYLSFGPLLERCRFNCLEHVTDRKHALLLGDGDGRFLARLLARNPELKAHVVDSSGKMLELLAARVRRMGASERVTLTQVDLLDPGFPASEPLREKYDLVVTHFVLDCFNDQELEIVVNGVLPALARNAIWIVSEFCVPAACPRLFARILIRALYGMFGLFTGLAVRSLPNYSEVLKGRAFVRQWQSSSMHGLLVSELWRRMDAASE